MENTLFNITRKRLLQSIKEYSLIICTVYIFFLLKKKEYYFNWEYNSSKPDKKLDGTILLQKYFSVYKKKKKLIRSSKSYIRKIKIRIWNMSFFASYPNPLT